MLGLARFCHKFVNILHILRLFLLGSVVVRLPEVGYSPSYILLKNINNPNSTLSSYFQLCIRKNGVHLECHKDFARMTFTSPPLNSTTGLQIRGDPSPLLINRGTSYIMHMTVSSIVDNFAG